MDMSLKFFPWNQVTNFPGHIIFRCAENFLYQDKKGLTASTASKAFREVS